MTSKKQQEKRKPRRAQFDLDPEVRTVLRDLSEEYGIPQSQIVTLFIHYGLEALQSGEIDLSEYVTPSRAPMWRYNLSLDKFKNRKK